MYRGIQANSEIKEITLDVLVMRARKPRIVLSTAHLDDQDMTPGRYHKQHHHISDTMAPPGRLESKLLSTPEVLFTSFRTSSFSPVDASSTGNGRAIAVCSFITPSKLCSTAPRCSPHSIAYFDQVHGNFCKGQELQSFTPLTSNTSPHHLSRVSNNGSHHVTTANFVHRTSPVPSKKYKTEMCRHMEAGGRCEFGERCTYAHSEQERKLLNPEEERKDDQFQRPCLIMVSTGKCPYGKRCKHLHDPRIINVEHDVVLHEVCAKATKNFSIKPDRLHHHRIASTRQENPIVPQHIWEFFLHSFVLPDSIMTKLSREFKTVYNFICNSKPDTKILHWSEMPPSHCVFNNSIPQALLCELQRLSIVLMMRAGDNHGQHLDFTYEPRHCINGQPCMVLQTRYFYLSSCTNVAEVTEEDYQANSGLFICAHEVTFDSKGKRSCNHSIWFNTTITSCSGSKAKKLSRKDEQEQWHLKNECGIFFVMPINQEFKDAFMAVDLPPYVLMQPVDDLEDGHNLITAVLKHRVASILQSHGFKPQEPPEELIKLGEKYHRLKRLLDRWAWPKTSDTSHFLKNVDQWHQANYRPEGTETAAIWESFVMNISSTSNQWHQANYKPEGTETQAIRESFVMSISSSSTNSKAVTKKRLPVFASMEEEARSPHPGILPQIRFSNAKSHNSDISCAEKTWRELSPWRGWC
ncbi:hypothetical protein ACHAXA_009633 [Cyclostephanos tholiformis]|uniref:C3H1-type domain-containing protein n=1 Tax=Cyclostephanos tholiformis TaxID=382380 RepID=A0ABD3SDY2_9STRA